MFRLYMFRIEFKFPLFALYSLDFDFTIKQGNWKIHKIIYITKIFGSENLFEL
jgi:hypothetical protein